MTRRICGSRIGGLDDSRAVVSDAQDAIDDSQDTFSGVTEL